MSPSKFSEILRKLGWIHVYQSTDKESDLRTIVYKQDDKYYKVVFGEDSYGSSSYVHEHCWVEPKEVTKIEWETVK